MHKADLPAFPWPMVTFPANRFPLDRYATQNAEAEAASIAELALVLEAHLGKVAAILVEPIQSEGGDRHASAAFFRSVQKLAREAGAALIFDEVQTGVGITGSLWAHTQFDLPEPPDMMTFGKKMQMGGFFAVPDFVISRFGRMYQTRNGDRARAALSLGTLETIDEDSLLDNVRSTGAHFLAGLEELATAHPKLVSEARGRGFVLAFDLPTPEARNDFLSRALGRGVFATYTGTRSVRLRPHLITTKAHVDDALSVFHEVLREMSA
jgi:4-aminobutyrate aminotransferase/(S)-3-amino-2-methylpropionate transaminase